MRTSYGNVRRTAGEPAKRRKLTPAEKRKIRRKRKMIRIRNNIVLTVLAVMALFFIVNNIRSLYITDTTVNAETNPESETPAAVAVPVIEDTRKTVLLDPGHGGNDPGCNYGGVFESELVLQITEIVRDSLEKLGYKVVMTRTEDVYVAIPDRFEIAENSNADILVSIHLNALENDNVTRGMETLYNEAAHALNSALAGYIQEETIKTTSAKDRGVLSDKRVMIIKVASLPSCLVEVGFLSSDEERSLLLSDAYKNKVAQGIVNGIEKFYENHIY